MYYLGTMEVDHVPYIFGSFSRRRHSQELSKSKRRSIDNSPHRSVSESPKKSDTFQRTRSLSKPFLDLFLHPKKEEKEILEEFSRRKSAVRLALDDTSPIFGNMTFPRSIKKENTFSRVRKISGSLRTKFEIQSAQRKCEQEDFVCKWCQKIYTEPRVLNCLHSFCTKCLFDIETEERNSVFEGTIDLRNGSVCSEMIREHGVNHLNGFSLRRKRITCPICEKTTLLLGEGIHGLPHNYILQHKLVLASLNQESTKLLCDICTEEHVATHRCSECLINLCPSCTENHVTQVATAEHELLALRDRAITKIARQVMCRIHKEKELTLYCSTCSQVACRECMRTIHCQHVGELPSKACNSKKIGLTDALERTRSYTERAEGVNERMKLQHQCWVNKCTKVEEDIENFIEDYKRCIDDHKKSLLQQVSQVKEEQLQILNSHQYDLDKKIQDAKNTIHFTDEILKEGTEIELLTFVDTILRKLQILSSTEEDLTPPKITESVQFLENEVTEDESGKFTLYGVISTQKVSLENCIIKKEGSGLDNLRVHRRTEITLETRDSSDNPLSHGGLKVEAELSFRDAGMTCRSISVHVMDRKDGTYSLTFYPETPGKLSLAVFIKGMHIKNSPFPITVRNIRPHKGVYHCCSFCSGTRGPCGCGGRMPGSQKGCGHGHEGHPGRRHWSCCGNVLENSECRRPSQGIFQVTL